MWNPSGDENDPWSELEWDRGLSHALGHPVTMLVVKIMAAIEGIVMGVVGTLILLLAIDAHQVLDVFRKVRVLAGY